MVQEFDKPVTRDISALTLSEKLELAKTLLASIYEDERTAKCLVTELRRVTYNIVTETMRHKSLGTE